MTLITRITITLGLLFLVTTLNARPSWNEWLGQLKQEAVAQGIRATLFDQVFEGVEPNRRVTHFDKTQPEHRITFLEYRKTRIDPFRIKLGAREYNKNRALLEEIGNSYSVDPCFIVAEWGIESSYGRYMGEFGVIKSLATLAYDSRRSEFFRKELFLALHILNEGHVSNEQFKGEWAGASGHPQFLPSSWHKYAVDYNKDGRKDIWNDRSDVFASIANYLKQNGWRVGEPWSIEVELPANFPDSLEGKTIEKPISEWVKLGVKPANGFILPNKDLIASIVKPYGGPVFMIFQNYRTLLRYNNSIFYAGAVGYLADQICVSVRKSSKVLGNYSP